MGGLLCPSLEWGSGLHRAAMSAGDYDSARGITGKKKKKEREKAAGMANPTQPNYISRHALHCK